MRVGIFASELSHQHGWAHYSASLIRALRAHGIDMVILTPRGSIPPDDLRHLPIHPILPPVTPIARGMVAQLAALIPQSRRLLHGCDVIHAHAEPYLPLAVAVAGKHRLFVTGHGSYVRIESAYPCYARPIYQWAFRRAQIGCVSEFTARAVQQGIPGAHPFVIPNGVDWERFAALPVLNKQGNMILTVGAVKPRKGTLTLIQAMPEVCAAIPSARCHIIGSLDLDPGYVAVLRAEIERLKLGDTVTLAGRVPMDDLMRAYASADVFAFPSISDGWKFEGFGLAALEASAAGLPVVAASGSGVEDAVRDGETGILIPPSNPQALAAALINLLSDPKMRQTMGEAGQTWAKSLTWDRAAKAWIEVYQH